MRLLDQHADPALERRGRADHALGLSNTHPRLVGGCGE
jgi:hypothetical protein